MQAELKFNFELYAQWKQNDQIFKFDKPWLKGRFKNEIPKTERKEHFGRSGVH